MKKLYGFERCEAAKPDGKRCQYEATEAVFNPGAPFPYNVCGVHERQGERSIERTGALPELWRRYWKLWVSDDYVRRAA
jgi:hypothetical protein